ncbi:MAG: gliding motility-associated C-terminal domain-containing protein [Chitinophagales bacterium]|nr:gliding motility-associated C-terminal domain-containing protein [Chitinophagales bacterium]
MASFTFSVPLSCDSATIQFTNTSTDTLPLSYFSHFANDSIADTLANPVYTFTSCGSLLVTLEVTDSLGQTDIDSQLVIIHCSPVAGFNFLSQNFCDSALIQFNDASTSADSIVEWFWVFENESGEKDSSFLQNPEHNFIGMGKYFITLTVTTVAGCSNSLEDSIIIHSSPIANAGSDQTICSGDSAQLNASGGIFFLWSPVNSLSDATISNPFSFPNSTTTYSVIVTDEFGCSNVDLVKVNVAIPQQAIILNLDSSYCSDHAAVTLIANPAGGIFLGNGISGNEFLPESLTPGYAYTIEYLYTDSIGCISKDSATTFIHALPNVAITANASQVCKNGNPVLLLLNPANGILLGEGISGNSFDPTLVNSAGDFLIQYSFTDSFGCSNSDSISIKVLSLPIITAGNDTAICKGDSVQLNATGGISYSWSPQNFLTNPLIQNPIAFNDVTTLFIVTGVDSNSCTAKDSILVTVNTPANASAGNDTSICFGESTTLTASGGTVFNWSPSTGLSSSTISNPVATPLTTTKYFVTVSTNGGCEGVDSVLITVHPLPIVIASADTIICSGDTIQLSASGAPLYVWSPAIGLNNALISNPLAFPSQTTLYSVTGINLFGCKNSDSVLVSIFDVSNVSAGNDTSLCIGDTIQLHAMGANSYSWSPANFMDDATSAMPTIFPSTTTTFILTAMVGTCASTDSVAVTVNLLPQISAGNDATVCVGSAVQLGASGGVSYEWSPSNYLSDSSIANPFASPPFATTYLVKGTDANGCSNTDEVSIAVFAIPEITITVDSAMCDGDSIPMFATGGIAYEWFPTTGLSQPNYASTLVYPPVTTTYFVTVTNSFGCTATDSAKVIVNELPNVVASDDQVACPGIGIQLNASGADFYSWSPSTGLNNANIDNPIATISNDISYVVFGEYLNGCKSTDTVNLTILPPLTTSVSSDTIICSGSSAQLIANGGIIYSWTPSSSLNDASLQNPVASPAISTSYTVYISDGICYTDTLGVNVIVQAVPIVNAGGDAEVVSGTGYQMNAEASEGTYSWLPFEGLNCSDCLNPVATPIQTTTYTLTATDSIGCTASDSVQLFVKCGEDVVFVPNAFTPNDNNQNDIFYLRTFGTIDLHFFRVYDRWGKMIFNTSNPEIGWNGKYNDKPMPAGVYLFEWELSCSNGDVVKKQGNVTLLR